MMTNCCRDCPYKREKKMKTAKQARQEAFEELSRPEYQEIRNLMLQDIIEIAKEIAQYYKGEENE